MEARPRAVLTSPFGGEVAAAGEGALARSTLSAVIPSKDGTQYPVN
jgi:hypothetical protein